MAERVPCLLDADGGKITFIAGSQILQFHVETGHETPVHAGQKVIYSVPPNHNMTAESLAAFLSKQKDVCRRAVSSIDKILNALALGCPITAWKSKAAQE